MASNAGRIVLEDAIDEALGLWCASHASTHIINTLEAVQVPVHPHERLLHQILGPLAIADHPEDEVEQPHLVAADQLAEGPLVAGEVRRNQSGVFQVGGVGGRRGDHRRTLTRGGVGDGQGEAGECDRGHGDILR